MSDYMRCPHTAEPMKVVKLPYLGYHMGCQSCIDEWNRRYVDLGEKKLMLVDGGRIGYRCTKCGG